MLLIQRIAGFVFAFIILLIGYKFQMDIPKVGATGEAVNIGGNFYPTSLVLWFFWIITIGIAGIFFLYAVRPVDKSDKE